MKNIGEQIQKFIMEDIRPRIKASPQIENVIVWLKKFDEGTGTVYLGLALGNGVGCSPFCGCAANQIAEIIGQEISGEFPEVKRVVGLADIPSEDIIKMWNETN